MRSAENSLTEATLADTLIAPSRPSPACASGLSALAKRRAAASALLRGSTTGAAAFGRYCKKKIAASGAGPSPTVLGRAAVGIGKLIADGFLLQILNGHERFCPYALGLSLASHTNETERAEQFHQGLGLR
jgi:hypothetical protein